MRLRYLKVLGWAALILLVLEVGLEARAYRRGFSTILFGDAPIRFGVEPDSQAIPSAELGPTTDFPFRSRVVSRVRQDDVARIWFASASHAEDIAVAVGKVFPNQMGELLDANGQRVEILNASRAGLIFSGNTRDLLGIGPDWKPDVAILYGGSMDLGYLSNVFLAGAAEATEDDDEDAANGKVSGPFLLLDEFYENTAIYAQLKANVTTLITKQRLLADELPSEATASFRESVNEFLDAAHQVGTTPVLTTLATSHGWNGTEPLPLEVEKFILRNNPHLDPPAWLAAVRDFNDVIRDVAVERGVLLLDTEGEFTGRADLFRDPVHFTLEGHREVAMFLADGLAEALGRP